MGKPLCALKVLALAVFLAMPTAVFSQTIDPKLVELRKQFAERYLQPDAHFALAKYYIDHGGYLQAFFIIENARRNRFEKKDFDTAYFAFFGDPMPEPPIDAKNAFFAGSKLVTEGKYDEAEIYFQKADKIYDKSFVINAWIGRFFYKTKPDPAQALPFYFKAYFLYPHAYETEFAESRIRAIAIADADTAFKTALKNGKSFAELSEDPNPMIVTRAIEAMGKEWKPEYQPVLLETMANDDSSARWGCFVTLQKNAGAAFDQIVDELLNRADLRKRGLAAYGVVERPGEQKYKILKSLLNSPAELIRFDAASALLMRGGETGRHLVASHQAVEKQPRLKRMLAAFLENQKN